MKKNILIVVWGCSIIVAIIANIYFNLNHREVYDSTNYIFIGIIELLNLIFGFLIFSKKN